jgi:hypothetical protein
VPISQNVLFRGTPPPDEEFEHPPGCYMIRALHKALTEPSWTPSQFDNWRDCGWSIECIQEGRSIRIAIAQVRDSMWMLQIAPSVVPGLLGRLFKKQASAAPEQCLDVAKRVHNILSSYKLFSDFRWRWDGYPDDGPSTSAPAEFRDSS